MNTKIIKQIKKEISSLYIPYYEISINFIKNFAKEKNIILSEEEAEYIFKQFKNENNKILLNFDEEISTYKTTEPQVLDWTNKFKKAPTLQEVRAYVKKLVDEAVKFATLSSDWFIDVIGNREKRKHVINSSQRKNMSKSEIERHNKYIFGLEELVNNSIYLNSEYNRKPLKKPSIKKYHYFESRIKIAIKEYKIILHTEQYIGESEEKPQTVHLYDVLEVSKKTSGT